MTTLQQFLIERKFKLLDLEKRATGAAQVAILAQLQMIDATLIFLASQQTEDDMAKLQLSLDKQARPLDELKPRQETEELTEAIIELANTLKPNTYKSITVPGELKVKPRSITSKVYALKKSGKLPASIHPVTRGKDLFLVRKGDD